MNKYCVKAGKSAFSPADFYKAGYNVGRGGLIGMLPKEAEYELRLPNGDLDRDQADWLKFGGRTLARTPWGIVHPHANSSMLGVRFNPILGVWELTFYRHVDRRVYHSEQIGRVASGEPFVFWDQYDYNRREIRHYLLADDEYQMTTKMSGMGRFSREIGSWWGGWDNDGNEIGGKAPFDMYWWKTPVREWKNGRPDNQINLKQKR